MDENKNHEIEELKRLARENNEILHKMRRSQKITNVLKAVYWVILVGIAVGAYVWLQPYFNNLLDTYGQVLDTFEGFR